ncbi:MAG: serine/threonine-protein kinase [Gammaproteobacteria bacterium]|nr:serine/threonine-protein kinase [Gammaproteobacteria bacterium]
MKGLENQTLGKYELVREIGQGSMGTVYQARDPFSLRDVAVKIADLRGVKSARTARRRRKLFYNEAKAAGRLRHPNIISTIDAGIEDGLRYLVMEYVPNAHTLDDYCTPQTLLPLDRVVSTIIRCAIAFDYAHGKGVIHRDIKPKNIMVTQDNEVKICDFGIALLTSDDIDSTQVIGTLGSPRYMAPEQITGEGVTNQSDLFSLGVVMYEMLVGKNPFLGKTMADVQQKIVREAHPPIGDFRKDVPQQLIRIVDRTLKKHPVGRYRVAMELAADLNLVYQDMKMSAREMSGEDRLKQLEKLPFFEGFDESDINEVLSNGTWRDYDVGEKIIVEGSVNNSFFILVSGRASVRRGGEEIDVLQPGTSFGEIGLVLKQARTATIVAKDAVTAVEINANHIEQASLSCQLKYQKAFLRTTAQRLSAVMSRVGPSESD